jgi:hypothetical protein
MKKSRRSRRTVAPSIFIIIIIIIIIITLHIKKRTSSYAPKRKRQITAKFRGQCGIVGPQNGSRFTSNFSYRESVTSIILKNLLGRWHNPHL